VAHGEGRLRVLLTDKDIEERPVNLSPGAITRELEAMSDWELERGLASSLGFDQDQRIAANRILSERYAGRETGDSRWGGRDRSA
jgi:hypothetical protein